MSLAEWSVKNRVAVNLLAIFLLVSGILAATTRLKLDLFPDVSTNFIQVTTLDPNASVPEEVERTITVPIEEELASVRGITRLTSYSEDNFSNIFIEVDPSVTNLDPILNEVRQAVDKAKGKIPPTVEPPIIQEFDIPFPLITFTISYPAGFDAMEIRPTLERLKRRLRMIPGVSDVLADGLDRREVWVEVDPFLIQAAGVSMEEITEAIRRKNLNAVAGRIDAEGGQRLVRLLGEIRDPEELSDIPIKTRGGKTLLLRDVATFKDTTESARTYGRADLRPGVTFTIVKKKGADAIQTTTMARRVFAAETQALPDGVEARVLSDTTRFIKVRIGTVVQNGIQALLLVTVLLMLTLNWRLALLVAIGIPISFAGTFLVLYIGGYSINLLSLFAMIMALGMVVDDAIVIAENCYRYLQAGLTPREAAIKGAQEVLWPVVGSVSTTVAAFLPLIWAEGIIGKFLLIVPVVVISTLMFSLVQAFIILPSHISDFVRRGRTAEELRKTAVGQAWFQRFAHTLALTYRDMRDAVDHSLNRIIDVYTHLLTIALRWRYVAIGCFLAMLTAAGSLIVFGVVQFRLFATDFADLILIKAELPADYSLEQTEDILAQVERRIVEELPSDDLLALVTRVGARFDPTNQFLEYGTNLGLITVDIDEENPSCRKPTQIARDLRRVVAEFPEFVSIVVQVEEGGPPVGRPVNVEIRGENFDELLRIADQIESRLQNVNGVYNIGNDFPRGKTEFQIRVDEARAAKAGVDVTNVARALQAGFFGLEAGRMRWGNEEVILRVKMAPQYRQDPEMLLGFRLINRDGRQVDLTSVATVEKTSGMARIKRISQERVVTVSADIEEAITTSMQVNGLVAGWTDEILQNYPGATISLTGENEDTERSLNSMLYAALIALLLIYGLLAVITNSFLQPVVIMSVIPFGLVGVILGLMIMGQPIGLMAMMGTVALAGIVVNNSVVFVDFINRCRHNSTEGNETPLRHQPLHISRYLRWRSIIQSGRIRFRPVFLTSATTIAGLSNLAFVSSGQEQFLAPMAQAIIFGLGFASLITMVLIPCVYSVIDDLHGLMPAPGGNRPKQPSTSTTLEETAAKTLHPEP